MFVIDACRDNPLATDDGGKNMGVSRGVGRIEAQRGEFVFFAAWPGERALDRLHAPDPDPNSVYTRFFLRFFQEGVYLEDVANDVQEAVYGLSLERGAFTQRPYHHDGTIGRTCLEARCERAPEGDPFEAGLWARCRENEAAFFCRSYLHDYPDGAHAAAARGRLAVLDGRAEPPEPDDPSEPEPAPPLVAAAVSPPALRGDRQPPRRIVRDGEVVLLHRSIGASVVDLAPGDRFKECAACPEMVMIPGGSFLMGSPEDEEGRASDEGPQTRVEVGARQRRRPADAG